MRGFTDFNSTVLRCEHGAVLPEAALVLPFFFFLIGFILDAAIALTENSLYAYTTSAVARDIASRSGSNPYDPIRECKTYRIEARKALQAALAKMRLTYDEKSSDELTYTRGIEGLKDGKVTVVGAGINVGGKASPLCLMCLFTKNLFKSEYSAFVVLEDDSCIPEGTP